MSWPVLPCPSCVTLSRCLTPRAAFGGLDGLRVHDASRRTGVSCFDLGAGLVFTLPSYRFTGSRLQMGRQETTTQNRPLTAATPDDTT